ncbi:sugar ABC transporter ATP-binding protein [Streptomyces sp. SID13666]|uniref:sugar ABC transporter ATP-binding protein n=1 Tax=Streptomyces TaxID=1883 RepID=UPI001106F5E0|nr:MULTISPECIES: sugar ABC transporter ATP-binding protein [Streptomyces]MCZ4095470.1 sugar ABC transporter ATP-binding protein [Streptomyces sp. H39-C1]NEA52905.1 sugar ABC transporter ATP-binding protein [Streptomyces sp. SID13666]NEA69768.1 sugar ABC transporter ATP-binding protein [Streptomyces sp. SID13588]QNA71175.1 sugar ABC transporter ATP-binding protein [Streptomyces sp. So13.3]
MSTPQLNPAQPVLRMTGITKEFAGVRALSGVGLDLYPGEVHALMGENGAGKSTLIKVLTGVHEAEAGTVTLDGVPVRFAGPLQAQQAGISTVYQEVNLCPNLSVAENIFLGREPRRLGRIMWSELRRRARDLLSGLDLEIDVRAPLDTLPLALQQMVAIARAVDIRAKVLILDEPTSSLDREEVAQLFTVIRRLRGEGVAILFVTHFLDQVYDVSDRITVLRDGRLVGEYRTARLPQIELVSAMLGQELGELTDRGRGDRERPAGTPFAEAHGLGRKGAIAPFDLAVRPGEVLGLAGLLGAGRSETARLLAGADRADTGRLTVDGRTATLRSPRAASRRGIAFCSENRRREGIIPDLTVRENIVLALQAARGWVRALPARRTEELVTHWISALHIHPADPEAVVRNLSGGNQQKVLLARWLITEPKLLILDEPTRGIDIGAKAEIQRLVASLAADGMAVVYVSAELEEVLSLSDTVAVLRDRELVATLPNTAELTLDRLMETIATGGTH